MSNKQKPRRKITQSFKDQPVITQQHLRDDTDINVIMKRFSNDGLLPPQMGRKPEYGYASSQSFTEAMFKVRETENFFNNLPSELRSHYENDPARFLDALESEDEQEYLASYGIQEETEVIEKQEETAVQPAESADDQDKT